MHWLSDPAIWASLLSLTLLEIILGIDNIIFISIVANRLPAPQRASARRIGLTAALVLRLAFLSMIAWIASLTEPLFTLAGQTVSWRDVILLAGGLFLLYKATVEIHGAIEGEHETENTAGATGFAAVIGQIIVLDLVFSVDSVITAVGLVDELWIMMTAVILAMAVMLTASGPISRFINDHPSARMLALSFLLLVGVALVADGLHFHIPRGYLYFAIAFSAAVEALNFLMRRRKNKTRP